MAEPGDVQPLVTDDVRELMRLMTESDIAEVLIERGDAKIHIKRANPEPRLVPIMAGTASHVVAPVTPYPAAATAPAPAAVEPEVARTNGVTVNSPMVGTFYAAPAPKDPPYVRVGDEVRPGDVLGIVEAMKIMNEIECEIQGRVVEVLVETGQAVEYGQPLMVIDPA